MALSMPLEWLIAMVGIGVPGFVLLNHLTGNSARHRLTEDEVQAVARKELGEALSELQLADDGLTALGATGDGTLVVAWSMESLTALRTLPPAATVADTGKSLVLRLRDAGFPRLVITLADADTRAHWQPRLRGDHRGAA